MQLDVRRIGRVFLALCVELVNSRSHFCLFYLHVKAEGFLRESSCALLLTGIFTPVTRCI
jgi:hypothetical protein